MYRYRSFREEEGYREGRKIAWGCQNLSEKIESLREKISEVEVSIGKKFVMMVTAVIAVVLCSTYDYYEVAAILCMGIAFSVPHILEYVYRVQMLAGSLRAFEEAQEKED